MISAEDVLSILNKEYGIAGTIKRLPGDVDINFRVITDDEKFVIKFSSPEIESEYLDFLTKILMHFNDKEEADVPRPITALDGSWFKKIKVQSGSYYVRMITWIDGKVWADVPFLTPDHYEDLGAKVAHYGVVLSDFEHDRAHRYFEWDLNAGDWVKNYFNIWNREEYQLIHYFHNQFARSFHAIQALPKSIIHNDANNYNVLVHKNGVKSIIDFGDAIYTSRINDLAIAIAYAAMDVADPYEVAIGVTKGYNGLRKISAKEADLLYVLVAIRLVISLTKSRLNFQRNPGNEYHQISAGSAWNLLKEWRRISKSYFIEGIRDVCNLQASNGYFEITEFIASQKIDMEDFLGLSKDDFCFIPFGVDSNLLGRSIDFHDPRKLGSIIEEFCQVFETPYAYGGYMECRPFYPTNHFKQQSVKGNKRRTIHIGEDYWVPHGTKIRCPIAGEIVLLKNNDFEKDYGPTIVLEHAAPSGKRFYTLYGHLDPECLERLELGQFIQKGDVLAYVGKSSENGNWTPHLHFQIILDLLGNKENFPGVGFPEDRKVWKILCPDPKILVDIPPYPVTNRPSYENLVLRRASYLSKSLSLSYREPLVIVRGDGAFLIDHLGQKYLDLVNNVAHVGHENPRVVKTGQQQMAILNTNSRYLHPTILDYAEALLYKMPAKYSKVFFVNSGSEANDLALRMIRTATGKKNVCALEYGYHGHTQACIEVSEYKFSGKGGSGKPLQTILLDPIGKSGDDNYIHKIQKAAESKEGLAGFIGESILSCAGQVMPNTEKMQEMYAIVERYGGYTIADEVQTGFGRVGDKFWAFELHGLQPDIVTLGKPMGNGHPIGAVVCSERVLSGFENGMEFFATYGGNPVSCAIGLEVLKEIDRLELQEKAKSLGNYLVSELKSIQAEHPIIYDVRGNGLFIGIEFRLNEKPATKSCKWIVEQMKIKKILLSTDGPENNVIKIKPPLVITREEVDYFLAEFDSLMRSWF